MKTSLCFFSVLFLTVILTVHAQQSPSPEEMLNNTVQVYEYMRLPNGLYRDSKLLSGTDYHPVSISGTGAGLILLSVADKLSANPDAKEQAIQTLQALLGANPVWKPDRNDAGFFRHWLDVETGDNAWNSEYSTIDNAILMLSAMFTANHFKVDTIAAMANELWRQIDWSRVIADEDHLYMVLNEDGSGDNTKLTRPFNEYMLVAWLAMKAEGEQRGAATAYWNRHYADPTSLPTIEYQSISLLTDSPDKYLSGFVIQFCYYLCEEFSNSTEYMTFFNNAALADRAWCHNQNIGEPYEWGLGAGSSPIDGGYYADAINDNEFNVVSPHIIAGFLPGDDQAANDLSLLWENDKGLYQIGDTKFLWRYSLSNSSWTPNEIQGIDYLSMLMGLAWQQWGEEFLENNKFTLPRHPNSGTALEFINVDIQHQTDFDTPDGAIYITATGNKPILYSIDSAYTWVNDSVFTGLEAGEYYLVIKDKSENKLNYEYNPVTISQPVGLDESARADNKINAFPNPVKNTLKIEYAGKKGEARVMITDIFGHVYAQKITPVINGGHYSIQLDFSGFATGIYLIRLISDEQYYNAVKIIKI